MIGPPQLIYLSGNLHCKKSVTSLSKCGIAPSCWNSMSGYTMPFTVHSAKKKGLNTEKSLSTLFGQNTEQVHLWTGSCMFSYFMRIATPPNSQIMSTLSNKWNVVSSLKTIFAVKVCHLQVLNEKESHSKMCSKQHSGAVSYEFSTRPLGPRTPTSPDDPAHSRPLATTPLTYLTAPCPTTIQPFSGPALQCLFPIGSVI
jgi:hypothetical protein